MAETLRMPPVEDWETFPFDGEMRPRRLRPPLAREALRRGHGGVECRACFASDSEYLWTTTHWRLHALDRPTGLPVVLLLEPRAHYAEPGDLPDDLAAELGQLLGRLDRAIRGLGEIGRVHIGRWGEGGEHLHWWFMARPARQSQLMSSFATIWDDVLPPVPENIWREDLEAIKRELSR